MPENTWEDLTGKYFAILKEDDRSFERGGCILAVLGSEILVVQYPTPTPTSPSEVSVSLVWLKEVISRAHVFYTTADEMAAAFTKL